MSNGYHEENLSESTMNVHRAITSMKEELEAVDWYHQRADATSDPELQAILEHNRDEEIEHACMLMEYLRRTMPSFDENMKTFLFSDLPITQIEEGEEGGVEEDGPSATGTGSLGIGALA
jgi:ferritin-like protein